MVATPSIRLAVTVSGAVLLASFTGGCGAVPLAGRSQPAGRAAFWAREQEVPPAVRLPLLIADFDGPGHQTNAGEAFGAWESDPGDRTQSCRIRLVDTVRLGPRGYGLMVEYDVDSPNPAYNGVWMKLPHVRLRDYDALAFSIKGDPDRGFTRTIRLELKGGGRVARFELEGIEKDWKQVEIPLREFEDVAGIWEATEFVIVFEDHAVTERTGALYLDNVVFEPAA